MSLIQRFLLGNRVEDDLQVGLFLKNDGTVWLRNPDGSETELPGGGGGGTVTISDTDPGATGAGSQWLRTDPGIPGGAGSYRQIYVRNAANDGWIEAGIVHYDADGHRLFAITVSDAAADFTVWDAEGTLVAMLSLGPESVTLQAGPGTNYIDLDLGNGNGTGHATLRPDQSGRGTALSFHSGGIDDSSGPFNLIYGAIDPSVDPGIEAVPGALYSFYDNSATGQLWVKTGPLDTDWTNLTP